MYEMFLDAEGKKISKSKGNGISMEQWLRYAPAGEPQLLYVPQPRKAKRLYFDVIPRAIDDYQTFLEKYLRWTLTLTLSLTREREASGQREGEGNDIELERYKNPVWHIHNGNPPPPETPPGLQPTIELSGRVGRGNTGNAVGVHLALHARHIAGTHPFLDKLATAR